MLNPRHYNVKLPTIEGESRSLRTDSLKSLRQLVYVMVQSTKYPYKYGDSSIFYNVTVTATRPVGPHKVEKEDVAMFLITRNKDVYYEHFKRNEYGKVNSDGTIIKNKWYKE